MLILSLFSMYSAEYKVAAPLSSSAANGVASTDDPISSKRIFSEGPCSHLAKKKLINNKSVRDSVKKGINSKSKKCDECSRKEKDSDTKPVDKPFLLLICLTCGNRLCESHAIAHSKAPRTGDDHPFYFDEDANHVRCFTCEVIVDSQSPNIKMVLNELKSLLKIKQKDDKPGDKPEDAPTVLNKPESKPEKKSQMHISSLNGTNSDEAPKENGVKKSRTKESPIPKKVENGYSNGTGEKSRDGLSLPTNTAIPARGLSNLGNTCFFNSVMQCMMHTHQLAFYLERFGRVSSINFIRPAKPIIVNDEKVEIEEVKLDISPQPTPINDALRAFIVDFRNGRTPSPSNLFNQIANKATRFRSMAQQDAHELLRYLLDGLCSEETYGYQVAIGSFLGLPVKSSTKPDPESARKAKGYLLQAGRPLLDAVFGGRLLQTIRCSKCHHVSERYENMYDLSVPLTGSGRTRTTGGAPVSYQPPSTTIPSNRPLSKHLQKKEAAAAAKKARKGSRSLKGQGTKKEEEDGSIEAKMGRVRLDTGETDLSEDEEDEEKENGKEGKDNGKKGKENGKEGKENGKENEKEVKEEEPESSDNEGSYRSEEKTRDPLDPTKELTRMTTPLPVGQSIAASLLEFTAEERLEGTNAYECEKCCSPANKNKGKTDAAKTRVEATKRYLIVTPPAVLTIHVKRFQQIHTGPKVSMRKFPGHVHFPLIFDIAPFCCKNVERISPGQTSILYSLYGVVSHSGSLGGGHYVAYVKSRDKLKQTDDMLEAARALCADVHAEPSSIPSPSSPSIQPEDAVNNVPGGQWYHCSDSRVSVIPESKVLSEEAYLLFYERIY